VKLIYANPNPVPSTDPPSLQVIHTVAGMAKTSEVHLVAQRGALRWGRNDDEIREAVAAYYGISMPENLHLHLKAGFDFRIGDLRLFWNLPFIAGVAAAIVRIMRSSHPADAILVRNLKLAEFLLRHRRLFRLPPVVFETHELFVLSYWDEMKRTGREDPRKAARLEARERYVYKHSDGLICITSHLASMIRERYGIDKPILVAPDGVDLDAFVRAPKRLRPSDRPPMVFYLGSLHRWKGVDVLLGAVERLPGVHAKIVGGNDETVGRYSDLARELGIHDRVCFEGYVQPARRFEYMEDADVFVLPLKPIHIASYFTSPLKLFEYMAAGRPIVASDLPAIREVLENDVNAVLVEPDSPDALAEGIRRVLENSGLGERLASRAAQDVERYTWDRRAQSILDFISSNWMRSSIV